MDYWLALDRFSILIAVLSVVFGGSGWIWNWYRTYRQRRLIARRVETIGQVQSDSEVAVLVQVGGQMEALVSARAYVASHLQSIPLLYYKASEDLNLADPHDAQRIVADLVQAARELGKRQLSRVHLFPAGMLAYQVLIGDLISNWCEVTVYHHQKGIYIPLYSINKDDLHRTPRETSLIEQSILRLENSPAEKRREETIPAEDS